MLRLSTAPYGYAILRSPYVPHGVAVDGIEAEHVRAMYRWVLGESVSAQLAKRSTRGRPPAQARL